MIIFITFPCTNNGMIELKKSLLIKCMYDKKKNNKILPKYFKIITLFQLTLYFHNITCGAFLLKAHIIPSGTTTFISKSNNDLSNSEKGLS